MQAIDVIMLTKNSEHMLQKCLANIYENVPVNNMIVVDGFSSDRTLKIVDEANKRHGNVKTVSSAGSRAQAREVGIRQTSTEWFMFADSDILLSKDWFQKATENIQDDVGAVWGVNIDVIPNLRNGRVLKLQSLIARACFNLRGGTHDTLIRRNLVKDIKIPEQLHTHEDAYIMNWIRGKGYRTVVGEDIYCLHYKPPGNWNLANAFSGAIQEFKCGILDSHNFAYVMYYPVFMFYWFLQIALQDARNLL
jgi:glycosyltransferase involved in cell wall biosynthesis